VKIFDEDPEILRAIAVFIRECAGITASRFSFQTPKAGVAKSGKGPGGIKREMNSCREALVPCETAMGALNPQTLEVLYNESRFTT